MSRIGKKPFVIPSGVTLDIADGVVTVKGPKGELKFTAPSKVEVVQINNEVVVKVSNPEVKLQKSLWGLTRALINNMVTGVTNGFTKTLEINGVGFKASISGTKLVLNLGYSHPIELEVPKGLEAVVEKNVITVMGIDRQAVGQFAANIRKQREPEPYKGKGIKYSDEVIRRKAGKVVKAVGAGK